MSCISCEYCDKKVEGIYPHFCSVYQMEVTKHTPQCDMYQKKQTKQQQLNAKQSENSKLRERIVELEKENQMLKNDFLQYAGFEWSELGRTVQNELL